MYERPHRFLNPKVLAFGTLAAILYAPSAEAQERNTFYTRESARAEVFPEASMRVDSVRPEGARLDMPVWQREMVASLLTEATSGVSHEYSGVEACSGGVFSKESVGLETCAYSPNEETRENTPSLKGLFSDERQNISLAIGGKAVRLEFEYTKIPSRDVLGQSFEGEEWRSVRAVIDSGEWDLLGEDAGLSVSLGYESFKASSLSLERLEENAPLDISNIYLGALPSRMFTAPGLKRDEGEGVILKVKRPF